MYDIHDNDENENLKKTQLLDISSNFPQGAEIVTLFLFYKSMFDKNTETEICEILKINPNLEFEKGYNFVR